MQTGKLTLIGILLLVFISGCSNQTAARVGNQIGIVLGKPLGVIATTAEQAALTTGKIVAENVRQRRDHRRRQQQTEASTVTVESNPKLTDTENRLDTQAPDQPGQQQPEGNSEFWQ